MRPTESKRAMWRARMLAVASLIVPCASIEAVTWSERSMTEVREAEPAIERYALANGVRVVLMPTPGLTRVALMPMVDVGLIDEPRGIPQAAHLLEHIACLGATRDYKAGESFAWLGARGMANAETLADHTRYDYVVDSVDLDAALAIEAQRLTTLRIDRAIIEQEGPRCHAEVINIDQAPGPTMLKFAFAAAAQSWRHGEPRALLKTGLVSTDPQSLADFHAANYRPDRLTLVIAGGFDPAEAKPLIERRFGEIKAATAQPPGPIDWLEIPKERVIAWDSVRRAVILTWAPPREPLDQTLLSLYASLLFGEIVADVKVREVASGVICTTSRWPVGHLPYFVYAELKPGPGAAEAARIIAERVHALAGEAISDVRVRHARDNATRLALGQMLTGEAIQAQTRAIGRENGVDMVLGQLAIEECLRRRAIHHDESLAVSLLGAVTKDRLAHIVRETISPERLRVLILSPMDALADGP